MERSQRQSDNVYRWIKLFADNPRKAEPAKVRPKSDAMAPPAPRRPDATAVAAPANTETAPTAAAPVTVATEAAAPTQAASAAAADTQVASAAAAAQAPVAEEPEEDEELTLIQQVEPEFPRELRNTISQGKVMLAFTVQPDGSVTGTTIVSASNRRLSKSAMEAVSKWRFTPIRTARTAQVEIEFNRQ